jgi:hypothetical protein
MRADLEPVPTNAVTGMIGNSTRGRPQTFVGTGICVPLHVL